MRLLLLRPAGRQASSAPKKISVAMAGNFLIRRGQLNRISRHCQADLIPAGLAGDDLTRLTFFKKEIHWPSRNDEQKRPTAQPRVNRLTILRARTFPILCATRRPKNYAIAPAMPSRHALCRLINSGRQLFAGRQILGGRLQRLAVRKDRFHRAKAVSLVSANRNGRVGDSTWPSQKTTLALLDEDNLELRLLFHRTVESPRHVGGTGV